MKEKELDLEDFEYLNKYGTDFTKEAQRGKFDPIAGRDDEIQRVIEILARRTKNNPCLLGEAGVGKSAIAEGLAEKIVKKEIPDCLKNKRIVSLAMGSMVAGTMYRGQFEKRMEGLIRDVLRAKNIILFIDEIHTMVGAGSASGTNTDVANMLKPYMARGEIQVIGATTLDEYKIIERDPALERRFQPVIVEEPSEENAILILNTLKYKFETYHNVKISSDAIEAAVKLSKRYIMDRNLPDKAIDLIDEASSKVKLQLSTPTEKSEVDILREKIDNLKKEKELALMIEEYSRASDIKEQEEEAKEKLKQLLAESGTSCLSSISDKEIKIISYDDIADVIAKWTGIPVKKLKEDDETKLLNLESQLHERVIGQHDAVKAISKTVRRGRVDFRNPNRPIGSFLFLGPTGVGKTEISKALSEVLFDDEDAMIRIDMSEYMELSTVSKLIGAPPGYSGHSEGGQLTEKVRRKPYSVILFDEIEKAHPDIFNTMLQILDDGHVTDSSGKKINFKNTVIIMTSNVGATSITEKKKNMGFNHTETEEDKYNNMNEGVMEQVRRSFRPEFINRIEDIIVFHQLSKDNVKSIAKLMLKDLVTRVKNSIDVELNFTDEAMDKIAEIGYDVKYGARPLRRAIQSQIEDTFAEVYLQKKVKKGDNVVVDYFNEEFTFNSKEDESNE